MSSSYLKENGEILKHKYIKINILFIDNNCTRKLAFNFLVEWYDSNQIIETKQVLEINPNNMYSTCSNEMSFALFSKNIIK